MKNIDQQLSELEKQLVPLIKALKKDICDDYRAYNDCDEDDKTPSMLVTIGFTAATEYDEFSWSYQTGDNSYTGGAYGHATWGAAAINRRSSSKAIAKELCDDIANNLPE